MGALRHISKINTNDQEFAMLAWPILVDIAMKGAHPVRGYKRFSNLIVDYHGDKVTCPGNVHHLVKRWLHCIHQMLFFIAPDAPYIGLLVKTSDDKFGQGLLDLGLDPIAELNRIRRYNWQKITFKICPEVVDAFNTRRVREKTEASQLTSSPGATRKKFLRLLKSQELDIKIELLLKKHEKEIVRILGLGMDISKAYLTIIRKYNAQLKVELGQVQKHYIYWGEYIDRNTNKPLFGHIKIGMTKNLSNRAKQLAGGVKAPMEFRIIGKKTCNPSV